MPVVERLLKKRTGRDPGRHQISALHIGAGHEIAVDGEHFAEDVLLRIITAGEISAEIVRLCKQQQIFRADGLVKELHKGFPAGILGRQYIRLHMELCHVQDVFGKSGLRSQPGNEFRNDRETFFFVFIGMDLSVDHLGRDGFPEVMDQSGIHEIAGLFGR